MAKTLAQWRQALYGVNIEPAKKNTYEYPVLIFFVAFLAANRG
jgi:hypothetical protein